MHFIKGVAKWATIWTVLLTGSVVFSSIRDGEPTPLFGTLVFAVLCWAAMAALVTIFRFHRFLDTIGSSLGRQVVRSPGRSAEDAVRQAAGDAVVAAGFKPRPPTASVPPPLPRT